MIQGIYRLLIELTNGRWTSHLLRTFAQSKVSRILVPSFSKVYKIKEFEMEKEIQEYPTLHHFFIRNLKAEARPIHNDPSSVVSPVDAVIEDVGGISANKTMTVKGKTYSVHEMLGNEVNVDKYMNGIYMVLYLSPSHYHRIHSPFSGKVMGEYTLGNKSYPVNKLGLKYGKDTLAKNYRVVTEVKHDYGHAAIVKVGAMFVNSIETIHEGEQLVKGQEIAYFTFGSTVVLLFEKDTFEMIDFSTPKDIKVGEKIGYLRKG
ncbi:phosphatidylserine decarboxylase (plasmid) [Bacillus sp. 31A1R]|uniref:Phosphatidylserine decarboxylase proenzyme n=1 Tax=Robertmurraya mangrovi TaxID=3098077 RepID=A0ABU5IUT7_9BACI|nr:phosphatidylserine decarboxylase [Bacillus sp. 31A1R]MDZ5470905.1 phosphatidylserine decarboxylase [Bacillus sp. 31A1R]